MVLLKRRTHGCWEQKPDVLRKKTCDFTEVTPLTLLVQASLSLTVIRPDHFFTVVLIPLTSDLYPDEALVFARRWVGAEPPKS